MSTSLQPRRRTKARNCLGAFGYSLSELILVISGLGVLAGVAISQFSGLNSSAQRAGAFEKMEMLNHALEAYATSVAEISSAQVPVRTDGADEQIVLLYLQFRDPSRPTVGAPYLETRYRPPTSSNSSDYRLQWAGGMFRLLEPGQSGTGLKVPFDGTDMGTPYAYPPNFRPLGR